MAQWKIVLLIFSGGWLLQQTAFAQSNTNHTGALFTGNFSTFGELYRAEGFAERRPGESYGIMFSGKLALPAVQIPLDIYIASENDRQRQRINRFSASPEWGWGKLALGTIVPQVSPLTLSGQRLLGGSVQLRPGIFRFAAAAGESRRALTGDSLENLPGAFRRWMAAGQIGLGSEKNLFMDLNLLYARDDESSVVDAVGAQPQANYTGSLRGGFALPQKLLRVEAELAASAHTRDTRAGVPEAYLAELPEFISTLTSHINLSTRAGYAARLFADLKLRTFSLGGRFWLLSPGFVSLGRPYMQNDRAEFLLKPALSIAGRRLRLSGTLGLRRNNIGKGKQATTNRLRGSLRVSLRFSRHFSLAGRVSNYMVENNVAARDSSRAAIDNLSRSASLSPTLRFRWLQATHALSVTALYFQFDNHIQTGFRLKTTHLNGVWTIISRKGLVLTPGGGFSRSEIPGRVVEHFSPFLGIAYTTPNRRVGSKLTLRYGNGKTTAARKSSQWHINGNIRFRLTGRDEISVETQNMNYYNSPYLGGGATPDFNERRFRFKYLRRF